MSHVPFGGPPPEISRNVSPRPRAAQPTPPRQPSRRPLAPPVKKPTNERIPPMRPTPKSSYVPPVKKLSKPKKARQADPQKSARLHDFLLGFFIGLVVFGAVAAFLCTKLLELFA